MNQTVPHFTPRAWKNARMFFLVGVVLAASLAVDGVVPLQAASGFEGVVMYRMTTPEMTADVVYSIKGSKARWETVTVQSRKPQPGMDPRAAATQMYMLYDGDAGTLTTVLPSQKIYVVYNMREASTDKPESSDRKIPKFVKTDRTETVAGYTCRHWLFGESPPIDMCLAQGLGYFGLGGQSGRKAFEAAFPNLDRAELAAQLARHPELRELVEGGAFPLKVESGKDFQMVVTKIERKSLSDDLFRPPAGYREMSMEQRLPPGTRRKPPSP